MRITLQCDLLFSYDVAFLNFYIRLVSCHLPFQVHNYERANFPMGSTHNEPN
jgi:hypothetical protein